MSARRRAAWGAADFLDLSLTLALAGTAQYEIWVRPLFDDGIPGPRLRTPFCFC